jgi:hypothetical protein
MQASVNRTLTLAAGATTINSITVTAAPPPSKTDVFVPGGASTLTVTDGSGAIIWTCPAANLVEGALVSCGTSGKAVTGIVVSSMPSNAGILIDYTG